MSTKENTRKDRRLSMNQEDLNRLLDEVVKRVENQNGVDIAKRAL